MSADMINVEFAALRSSADSLFAKARTLDNYLDQLHQHLAPITATWYASGSSAGQSAESSENRLRAAIADIVGVIGQFSGKVNEAHDLQLALENKNAGYFN